jgi:O-antigen ligase
VPPNTGDVPDDRALHLRSAQLARGGGDGRLVRVRGIWWAPHERTLPTPLLLVDDDAHVHRLRPLNALNEEGSAGPVVAGPDGRAWSATYRLPAALADARRLALDVGNREPFVLPQLTEASTATERANAASVRAASRTAIPTPGGAVAALLSGPQVASPAVLLASLGAGTVALGAALVGLRLIAGRPGLLPLALVGGLAAIALIARPSWILPAWIGLTWMAIGQSFFGGYSPVQTGAFVLLGVALWRAPEQPRLARDVLTLCALIGLPLAATALLSEQGVAFPQSRLLDLAFLAAVALNLRTHAVAVRLPLALTATGLFLGAGAAYSILVHPTALFPVETALGTEAARAVGPFGEPNFFALELAALLPFACWTIAQRRGAWRVVGFAAAIAIGAGVLSTGSRGGLIASGFALLAVALTTPSRGVRLAAVATILCTVALLPTFAAQTASSSERSVGGRANENQMAVRMFGDHPLAGVGPGGYPVLYRDYSRRYGTDRRVGREPHSLPLQIAAEQGIAGIVGWLGAGVLLLGRTWRPLRRSVLGRAVLISLGAYMVGSLFLHGSQLRIVYMLAGAALGLASLTRARGPEAVA